MEHRPRPLEYLQVCAHKYPHAWKQAEEMRADKGKGLPNWPSWCYLPLAGAYAIVSAGGRITTAEEGLDVSRVGALAAWRMTKGIYRFDTDILSELWRTPVAGDIPSQVLEHLPEWCVYIETARQLVMKQPLHGFFAHLEYDVNDRRQELRLLLDYDAGLAPVAIHLGGTLRQGLEQMVYETELQAARLGMDINALRARLLEESLDAHNLTWANELEPLVSLVIYLCSADTDISGKGAPGNPQPQRTKKGSRLFAAAGPRTWEVAYRLGAAFRQARAKASEGQGERQSPRPHMRRAHFHTFWTGARQEPSRRRAVVRWLPPIPVGFEGEDDNLPAVIRRVRR